MTPIIFKGVFGHV